MNGSIADSIIIRVGHGIMTIPRNKNKKNEESYGSKEPLQEAKQTN
jgi:hypothetical protein